MAKISFAMKNRILPYLFFAIGFVSLSSIFLVRPITRSIQREVETTSRVIAKLFSTLLIPATEESDVADIIRDVVNDVDFPMVVVDVSGTPRAWKGVGVDPKRFSAAELDRPELLRHDPEFQKLLKAVESLKEAHQPIPMELHGKVVGYIYYGNPEIVNYIKLLPLLLTIVGVLSFVGLMWAAGSIQRYQMEALWSMFAKGLAHQMGVPTSSLMGWFELLRSHPDIEQDIVNGMEKDLNRISSILQRFSRIGGGHKFSRFRLSELVNSTVREARERFLKGYSPDIVVHSDCEVMGDFELLSWAVENLVKNAYEARTNSPHIEIHVDVRDKKGIIRVVDHGRGIPPDKQKLIFKKGFTTKERGWGMGLLLTKRIVEDIHHGKIRLVSSSPGRETIFEIELPVEDGESK